MTYASKYPQYVKDIPADTKFIVLYNDSYSSDNGYPEDGVTTYRIVRAMTFNSEELMKKYIIDSISGYEKKSPSDFMILPYDKRVELSVKTEFNFQ